MGVRNVTVKGSDSDKSYTITTGSGGEFYIDSYSDGSIGKSRSLDDALSSIKSHYRGKVYSVDIGGEYESCFPGETLILTPTGWREIRYFERGDWLISYNYNTHRVLPRRVTKVLMHPPAPILQIVTDQPHVRFRATHGHTILTRKGWVCTGNLKIGDQLAIPESAFVTVTEIKRNVGAELVYNLYTAWQHNYIANGVVAHNFTHFRAIRIACHRLLLDWLYIEGYRTPDMTKYLPPGLIGMDT